MQNKSIPQIVAIIISKEGMNNMIKNIYTVNEIPIFFNISWNTQEPFYIKKVTKDLIPYILIPENEDSNLEDILNRDFNIQLISLNNIDKDIFNKENTPKVVFDILETYKTRISRSNTSVVISDDLDYS